MIRTYKRKLDLTESQENRLRQWVGVCRMIYNLGLEIKIAAYKNKGQSIHKYELFKQLIPIRSEYEWVRDVPSQCEQAALDRLDNSYKTFFRGGGFPRFASKKHYKSIIFKEYFRVRGNQFKIPKIGWVKMFKDSEVNGTPKIAILKIEPTGFFINIVCENVPKKFESENQAIGLDMGVSHFCVDSNGNIIANPKHFAKYERRLRIENRSLARKKKWSNGWKKQVKRLSLLHHKIGNVRKDFLHKQSTIIAKRYSNVYMEDLNVKGMSANRNLSKHILDAGWGMFKTMLQYKTNVNEVNARHSSQECSFCGVVEEDSRVSQSLFQCISCGFALNADHNAALNILSRGTALGRERSPIGQALALESKDISGKQNQRRKNEKL